MPFEHGQHRYLGSALFGLYINQNFKFSESLRRIYVGILQSTPQYWYIEVSKQKPLDVTLFVLGNFKLCQWVLVKSDYTWG